MILSFLQIPYQDRYNLPVKALTYANGQLYIGTDGEGLKVYTTEKHEITDKELEDTQFNLKNKKIHTILFDRNNDLWLGLFQQGVAFIPMRHNPFQYHGFKSMHGSPFGKQCVMSIFQDNKKNLLVGTDNDGLYILDNHFHTLQHQIPSQCFD